MKKLFAFILALAMTLALTVPAFAATPRGKGYTDGTVNVGNYDYPVRVQILTDSSYNAYTKCTTTATTQRIHNDIVVTYLTAHDGYITRTGGYFDTVNAVPGPTESNLVLFGMSVDNFRSISGMRGSVALCGDRVVPVTLTVSVS